MLHISLIWAMSENRVIGRQGRLPWALPRDMRFFSRTTMGKPVILGRKTFETLKAPLSGRTNIVLTRDAGYPKEGVLVAMDMDDAVAMAEAQCEIDGHNEIMVAGGSDIYKEALPISTRLYLTLVKAEVEGDTFFPEIDLSVWKKRMSEDFEEDEEHSHAFSISMYER